MIIGLKKRFENFWWVKKKSNKTNKTVAKDIIKQINLHIHTNISDSYWNQFGIGLLAANNATQIYRRQEVRARKQVATHHKSNWQERRTKYIRKQIHLILPINTATTTAITTTIMLRSFKKKRGRYYLN